MFFSKLFKKKQPEAAPAKAALNLPGLNEWGIFFQGNGLVLYSRFVGAMPNAADSNFMYLKSYPEVYDLERKQFGEWLTTSSTGVYLQQWDSEQVSWSLVFISFTDPEISVIKSGLKTAHWETGYEDGKSAVFIKDGDRVEILFIR
jgi:hypothetical protein